MNWKTTMCLLLTGTLLLGGCGGGGGSKSPSSSDPSVTLSVNPSSVSVDSATTLNWSSANATQCTASGGWSGARNLEGSENTPVLAASTTFTLTCIGPGGSSSESVTVSVASELLRAVTLPGFPHEIDVYRTAGATRAVVFLHGGAGRSYVIAYALGLNMANGPPTTADVDWPWLESNQILAVFPQGQRQSPTRNGYTWNNHVMQSGQDDVAFLQALASYIETTYGLSDIALAGHSNGGMMANRMWCESPNTFSAYIAIAGPAAAYYLDPLTPCLPPQSAPYYGIVGDSDDVLQVTPDRFSAETWSISPALVTEDFVDPTMIGEWRQHQARSAETCRESPVFDSPATNGSVDTWSNCGGTIVLERVRGAGHGTDSIEAVYGTSVRDLVAAFVSAR